MKKQRNINKVLPSFLLLTSLLIIWEIASYKEVVASYMLPAPTQIICAFVNDIDLILVHTKTTLIEAFLGLSFGIIIAFITSIAMDRFRVLYQMFYPFIIVSQTIPTIALAPLLVLWFGYDLTPKIILVILTVFFPLTIGLLNGYKSVDKDALQLMKVMGANEYQIYRHLKLPSTLPYFFAGLQIAVTYSIIGAVVAEWLGGFEGLGVYMTRVRKAYAFDKMFAIIFFISIISILLMLLVIWAKKKCMPWKQNEQGE